MENVAIREVVNLLKTSIEEEECEVWDLKSIIKSLESNAVANDGENILVETLKKELKLRCESISKNDAELKVAYQTYGSI